MARQLLPLFLVVLATLVDHTNAAASLTSTGCVDSSGLDKCMAGVETSFTHCIAQANGDQDQIIGCGCAQYIGNYNCYAGSCWNRVFECEYQNYMTEFFTQCPVAKLPVPYYPAPDGVPDACSCNMGKVLNAFDASTTEMGTCQQAHGLDATADLGCACCGASVIFSSIHAFCPTTDPSLLGVSSQSTLDTFKSCSTTLSQVNCGTDLGFDPTIVGGTFFTPDNLPASGTASLTNLPGTVTAPANGPVFTYTNGADGITYTVTAAKFKAGSAGSGSGSGSTSGGSSGSPNLKGNSAMRNGLGGISIGGFVILLNIVIFYL